MRKDRLRARDIAFSYTEEPILHHLSFQLPSATLTALMGSNGSGKTTLLKIVAGLFSPQEGMVWLEGQPLAGIPRKERAKRIAYVSQQPFFTFPLTVFEFVALGRYPYGHRFHLDRAGESAVQEALVRTEAESLKERYFTTLSGGERQKVLLARALAQTPSLLLLDEPTTHLDLYHQLSILRLLKQMCREGLTVLAVLHDLQIALAFADTILLLNKGNIVAQGAPEEVLQEQLLYEVFRVKMESFQHPVTGKRLLSYSSEEESA